MERFAIDKTRVLSERADQSRKGSVDAPVVTLVERINAHSQYYTTSSCSGRIVVFCDHAGKKGCQWLLNSHSAITQAQLAGCLQKLNVPGRGYMFLKFEPFVLHVMCQDMPAAQQLLQVAIVAGFRNSGITVGKKQRILLAVRSTLGLEVPVAVDNQCIITSSYMDHLVIVANDKLQDNLHRIDKFVESVESLGPMATGDRQTHRAPALLTRTKGRSEDNPDVNDDDDWDFSLFENSDERTNNSV